MLCLIEHVCLLNMYVIEHVHELNIVSALPSRCTRLNSKHQTLQQARNQGQPKALEMATPQLFSFASQNIFCLNKI